MGAYLLGLMALGLFCSRGQRTTDDFFLAGRKMGWLVLGMSMWASLTSANSMLAGPGYAFRHDLQFLIMPLVALLSAAVIMRLIIPVFQRLRITTSYEYLESRFGISVRLFGSLLFLLLRGAWLGGLIYAPALAVATVIDLPGLEGRQILGIDGELAACILVIGVLATLYTTAGGMKAVIYTDVVQFLVIAGGVFAVLYLVISGVPGGITRIWEVGTEHGRTRAFDFRTSPMVEITFWWILLNTFTQRINSEGFDQVAVQRYLSAKSIKDSARTILLNVLFDFPLMTAFYLIGLALFVFYQVHPDPALPANPDQVFPHFVVTSLPAGMSGLFLAALLAATQSSVDSGINSMSATVVTDWYKRLIRPGATDSQCLRLAKITTVVLGLSATAAAMFYIHLGQIYKAVGTTMGFFMGPLVGIFLLGLLTTRARTAGVIAGVIAGLVSCATWQYAVRGTWMLLPVLGVAVTVAVGYLASLLMAPPRSPLTGLTCWTPANPAGAGEVRPDEEHQGT